MDHHYDIAIIGMGCAGSHLILEFIAQKAGLKIVVLDNFNADSLEKTWSYWEKGNGKWDEHISRKWTKGIFKMPEDAIELHLHPYSYKTIESRDFIAFAKAELQKNPNFKFIKENVQQVSGEAIKTITCKSTTVTADLVLDSRVDPAFNSDQKAITLKQHFMGWVIKTNETQFNPEVFTMMDYSLQDPGTTSFTYVLPYSTTEALVEFTYFSKNIVADVVYETYLKKYLTEELEIKKYDILKVEQGTIPMSSYRFEQHNGNGIYKIGTAGGWVKPSTGYSFKMSEKKAAQLVQNILNNRPLDQGMISKKFQFYDDIMLEVLHNDNDNGDQVFHTLYKKNKIQTIFRFLDEETVFRQELGIMLPMTSFAFIKAFFKKLF